MVSNCYINNRDVISVRSTFLICLLKALADSADLMDLCSLDQIKHPVYLKLCLQYSVVLNLGKEKSSAFQRLYLHVFVLQ